MNLTKKIFYFILIITTVTSCNWKNKKNRVFKINYIQIELPADYNIQSLDSLENIDFMIKRDNRNLMYVTISSGLGYYNNPNLTPKQYTILIDSLDGFQREIIYNKKDMFLRLEIGKRINSKHYSHKISLSNSDLASLHDTNTLSGRIDYNNDKENIETFKNIKTSNDTFNYNSIMTASTDYIAYTMKINEAEIDTLIKYFKKIKIITKDKK